MVAILPGLSKAGQQTRAIRRPEAAKPPSRGRRASELMLFSVCTWHGARRPAMAAGAGALAQLPDDA